MVTKLSQILSWLCETNFYSNVNFWTWHFLHFLKGVKLAKCKQVLFTVMYLFHQKNKPLSYVEYWKLFLIIMDRL